MIETEAETWSSCFQNLLVLNNTSPDKTISEQKYKLLDYRPRIHFAKLFEYEGDLLSFNEAGESFSTFLNGRGYNENLIRFDEKTLSHNEPSPARVLDG